MNLYKRFKKIKNTLFIFVLFTSSVYCQENFYVLMDRGMKNYYEKDYTSAGKLLAEAFIKYEDKRKIESLTTAAFNAACSWSLANRPDSAYNILNRALEHNRFLTFGNLLESDNDLKNIRKDSRWKDFMHKFLMRKKNFQQGFDMLLVKKLSKIRNLDQSLRLKALELEKLHGGQSKEAKDQWEKVEIQDSLNFIAIENIIKNKSWPRPSEIGFEGAKTLFLVIQHAPLKKQIEYLPILKDAIKNGSALPSWLAYLKDRIALHQGEPQKYGTQLVRDGKTGKILYPYKLLNPDKVDFWGEKVGLAPIRLYLNENGAVWDIKKYKQIHYQ